MRDITVPTTETVSVSHFMKAFILIGHAPLLISPAGCGKTQIWKGLLNNLDSNSFTF